MDSCSGSCNGFGNCSCQGNGSCDGGSNPFIQQQTYSAGPEGSGLALASGEVSIQFTFFRTPSAHAADGTSLLILKTGRYS